MGPTSKFAFFLPDTTILRWDTPYMKLESHSLNDQDAQQKLLHLSRIPSTVLSRAVRGRALQSKTISSLSSSCFFPARPSKL